MKPTAPIPAHIPFTIQPKNHDPIEFNFTDENLVGYPMSTVEIDSNSYLCVVYVDNSDTGRKAYYAIHETTNGEKLFFELTQPEEKKAEFIQKLTNYLNSLDA